PSPTCLSTLSLHDALPICDAVARAQVVALDHDRGAEGTALVLVLHPAHFPPEERVHGGARLGQGVEAAEQPELGDPERATRRQWAPAVAIVGTRRCLSGGGAYQERQAGCGDMSESEHGLTVHGLLQAAFKPLLPSSLLTST